MFFSSSTLRLFDFSRAESCHRFDPLNVPGELVRALQQKHVQKWTNGSLTAQDGYILSFPPRILGVLSTVGFIVVQAQCYTQIGQDGKNRQRDFWNSEMFLGFSEIVEIATQQHCHGDFCAGQLLGIWISLKPRKKSYISYINIKNINCSNVVFHRKIAFIWDQASDPQLCYASCMEARVYLIQVAPCYLQSLHFWYIWCRWMLRCIVVPRVVSAVLIIPSLYDFFKFIGTYDESLQVGYGQSQTEKISEEMNINESRRLAPETYNDTVIATNSCWLV